MRAKHNPVFYPEQLAAWVGRDSERFERIEQDPESIDLLTWNLFMSLDTHSDPPFYAYRMQAFGGSEVRHPVRTSLWSGRDREPRLRPSPGYVAAVRERARTEGGEAQATERLEAPIEVGVRMESPEVLCFIEPMLDKTPTGTGGRDRIVEIVDAGLEHARRLSKTLAVAAIYPSGTAAAAEISGRLQELRDPKALAEEMPYRSDVGEVIFRELSWQKFTQLWEAETRYLHLGGQPVGRFREHLRARGLYS